MVVRFAVFDTGLFAFTPAESRGPARGVTRRVATAALLLVLATHVSGASGRKQLWTVDVSKLIGEAVNVQSPEPIWGLAFSPDETQLAIGFGTHWTDDPRIGSGHVVVVPVEQPGTILHRFDVGATPVFPFPGKLAWAPSGRRLAVNTTMGTIVFSLDGTRICGFADELHFAGFLSGDRTATYDGIGPDRAFEVHHADCTPEDTWQTPDRFAFALATCPQAGLLAAGWYSLLDHQSGGTDIVTYPGHKLIRQWVGRVGGIGHDVVFADACRLVCAGQLQRDLSENHAACWDIQTGNAVLDERKVTFAARPSFDGVSEDWVASTVYKVSCHFRLAFEMMGSPHKQVAELFAFAISAKHRFMAEGGSGRVQVYGFR
jgi:hypothetical protein